MNAKPTLLAAVVVIAAGVATGVAIGGKTETKTVTVTVAGETVTVAPSASTEETATGTASAPETQPGTETAPAGPDIEPTPGFQDVVLDETLVTIDDTTRSTRADSEVTLTDVSYGVPAQLQQGPEKNDAFTFEFEATYNDVAADFYQFEITVPDGATKLVSEMGFLKGEATGNSVKIAFYRNEYEEGKALKQREFDSASETAPLDLVVRGASKIIVRLECTNRGRVWKTPSDDTPSFGFLDAHFE